MKRTIISLTIILISSAVALAAQMTKAQQADSAYNKESYNEAVTLYLESIEQDGISSDIYYNLGNAYYRAGQLGKAIISYERALAVDPSNSEARTNLDFVRTRIVDIPEDDSSFLSNLHKDISALMTPNGWAVMAFVLFIILLSTVALYIFSSNVRMRKTGFFGGIVVLFLFVYTVIVASQTASAIDTHDRAIVTVPTTVLSSAPRSSRSKTEKVVPIHEGTKVRIIDSLSTPDDPEVGKWYDVKINNSTRAWLNAADVEKI